jgi:hypothetical protein
VAHYFPSGGLGPLAAERALKVVWRWSRGGQDYRRGNGDEWMMQCRLRRQQADWQDNAMTCQALICSPLLSPSCRKIKRRNGSCLSASGIPGSVATLMHQQQQCSIC